MCELGEGGILAWKVEVWDFSTWNILESSDLPGMTRSHLARALGPHGSEPEAGALRLRLVRAQYWFAGERTLRAWNRARL